MFKGVRCRILPLAQVLEGLDQDARDLGSGNIGLVDRIYLEGGDPLAIDTDHLLAIMKHARSRFPALKSFACYATAKFTVRKPQAELDALSHAGLRTLFIGLESGCDAILEATDKGCTTSDILNTGLKLAGAGIEMDVSMMLGIGGRIYSREHALGTANVINAIGPQCVRIRTFIPKIDTKLGNDYLAGHFSLLTAHETMRELKLMVANISVNTRLLSEHWSNFILFNAYMPEAKEALLAYIDGHLAIPESEFRQIGIDAVRS